MNNDTEKQIEELNKKVSNLASENTDLKNKLDAIYNSRSWKLLQKASRTLKKGKNTTKKMKIQASRFVNNLKSNIFNATRFAFNAIPIPKTLKNKIRSKVRPLEKVLASYSHISDVYELKNSYHEVIKIVEPLNELNKTIAVHLHLYYIDLIDEFIYYLNNIPYKYDLYVSLNPKQSCGLVKDKLSVLKNAEKIVISNSINCGRDYGPMFITFASDLKEYDYILHIQTKKSLRTGFEQNKWRRHLLSGVLASEDYVKKIFSLFEDKKENIGLVFPDEYDDLPLWGHTWLDARSKAPLICDKLGIDIKDEYLDFCSGSMFWVKTEAVKQLFDLHLTEEDFGKEKGQVSGTLEYVLERIFGLLVKKNDYKFVTFNKIDNSFNINYAHKNIGAYSQFNKEKALLKLLKYDVITFDIFDTLITRCIFEPDDIFRLIDEKYHNKYKLQKDFLTLRREAENLARQSKIKNFDCDIDDIYESFIKVANVSEKEALELKKIEIDYELKFTIPREDMLYIYNKLIEKGKTVILISDMYLTREVIDKMLNKCGYKKYNQLWLSCELNARKDRGTMWDLFFDKYGKKKTIHVGDNEMSDIHVVLDRHKSAFHVLQGKKMLQLSDYRKILPYKNISSTSDSIAYGILINKVLFNSPFAFNGNNGENLVDDLYKYGKTTLGPLFLYFYIWLIKNFKSLEKEPTILFVSREGYYLKKLYDDFVKYLKDDKVSKFKDLYFLTSRRASSVASIENIDDIEELLGVKYNGTISNLFQSRFGVHLNNISDEVIELPKDKERVLSFAKKNLKQIFEEAKCERKNYLKYIEKTIPDFKDSNPFIIDLGYSGSAQYYLSKFTDKKIAANYFSVSSDVKSLKIGCDVGACFSDSVPDKNYLNNEIFNNSLMLECLLTAPGGQLIKFDENGEPIFMDNGTTDRQIQLLDKIYNGIRDYIRDNVSLLGNKVLDLNLDRDLVVNNFVNLMSVTTKFDKDFYEAFKLEDLYCTGTVIPILESLKRRK